MNLFSRLKNWFPGHRSALGERAERLAERHLKSLGWKIVARNYRCRYGEIDLIAQKKDVLVFVEVRSRSSSSHGHPAETVGTAKQTRICRAAAYYLQRQRTPAKQSPRFDVITVIWKQPGVVDRLEHFPHAFSSTE